MDLAKVQYTIYWTGLLTKTNSVNKNINYNICLNYLYLKVFSPGDRAGLIDDVFYLARLVVMLMMYSI